MTLNNFSELFSATLYGRWYLNTLVISFFTMVIQVAVVTLAGYTYSRYNFAGKKWSLDFLFSSTNGPDDGSFDRLLCSRDAHQRS